MFKRSLYIAASVFTVCVSAKSLTINDEITVTKEHSSSIKKLQAYDSPRLSRLKKEDAILWIYNPATKKLEQEKH
ncbi:hypothetical protein A6J40_12020 [Legionella longbeachae]|uniref:hypothetical protein n=1 Tax=Legionella longbeachae TaxID=450 RepID=UPI0009B720AB|nr:hypothetical protein [Legionella longbeachae]ARB92858.1 hypothetical protein A6J40_12020 [Legionella longbeachae]RZV26507.1 hypothetical protein EKG34_05040 [Legionella longbeachae]UAK47254.1 hypothetical protein K8O86_03420 [Legionella longbeachae]VEE04319.1 Uncharacterised protein [Legionella oakridgensis]